MPWRMWAESEAELRAFSALFAALAVTATYLIGQRLCGKWLGFVAALFLATHPLFIRFAQDLRAYALLLALVCLSGLLTLAAVRSNSWKAWIATAVAGILCAAIHYYSLLAFAAQFAGAAWIWRDQIVWRRASASGALVIVGVIAQVFYSHSFSGTGLEFTGKPGLGGINSMLSYFSGGDWQFKFTVPYFAAAGIAVALMILEPLPHECVFDRAVRHSGLACILGSCSRHRYVRLLICHRPGIRVAVRDFSTTWHGAPNRHGDRELATAAGGCRTRHSSRNNTDLRSSPVV